MIDCLRTTERGEQAAKRFLTRAIRRHGMSQKIMRAGRAANEAAIKSYHAEYGTTIVIRIRLQRVSGRCMAAVPCTGRHAAVLFLNPA
jgi:transposase-like protein